jgi:energy-coupling factor transporter ATP-binding protein EcfA2
MKRHNLLLLTFLLSQSTSLLAMESDLFESANQLRTPKSQHPANQAQRLEALINKGITETEVMLSQHNSSKLKVMVMGRTGTGKSTLINLLAGQNVSVDQKYRICVDEPIQGSEIGHEKTSQTSFLSICAGPNDTFLVDTPGYGDTGGPVPDIVNQGMMRKVFSAGPVNILWTVSESDLVKKGDAFLEQINYLTKVLPYAQLENGLSIVITQQGRSTGMDPHEVIREFLDYKPQTDDDSQESDDSSGGKNPKKTIHLITEDVKKLLTHLTKEENIRTRIPYFPFPERSANKSGKYDAATVKENILESISSLTPIQNPELKIELSPESSLLVIKLAEDLNKNIKKSIEKIVSPKILQLCNHQTTAYASEGSMQGLESNIQTIKAALHLLDNDSQENMLKFANSFDELFSQGDNVVKKDVKTLMFLKTLNNDDITYSTTAWTLSLQSTLDEIHELIDTLATKLFRKVTDFAETINLSVMRCHTALPNSTDEESHIEELTRKLRAIEEAIALLQSATPENMSCFISPLEIFFHQGTSCIRTLEKPIDILGILNTLKTINYPKDTWQNVFNASLSHLQNAIHTQEKIRDLNMYIRKERELFQGHIAERERQEEELRRQAAEELRRQEEELRRQAAQELRRQEEELRRQAAQELRRQEEELRRQEAEALMRQAEELRRLSADELEAQRQLMLAKLDERDAVTLQQRQEILRLETEIETEQKRLKALFQEELTTERQLQITVRTELLEQLNGQRQLMLAKLDERDVTTKHLATELKAVVKRQADLLKAVEERRLADLDSARKAYDSEILKKDGVIQNRILLERDQQQEFVKKLALAEKEKLKVLADAQEKEIQITKRLAALEKERDAQKEAEKKIADEKAAAKKLETQKLNAAKKALAAQKLIDAQKLAAEKQRVLKIKRGAQITRGDYLLLPVQNRKRMPNKNRHTQGTTPYFYYKL